MKGATEHIYFTQYPYPTSERILYHPTRQATESLVRLCSDSIHRPFYQFDLFEHPSFFEHSLWPERKQTSILYVHSIKQATVDRTVVWIVEHDSKSTNGWPFVGRPG